MFWYSGHLSKTIPQQPSHATRQQIPPAATGAAPRERRAAGASPLLVSRRMSTEVLNPTRTRPPKDGAATVPAGWSRVGFRVQGLGRARPRPRPANCANMRLLHAQCLPPLYILSCLQCRDCCEIPTKYVLRSRLAAVHGLRACIRMVTSLHIRQVESSYPFHLFIIFVAQVQMKKQLRNRRTIQ